MKQDIQYQCVHACSYVTTGEGEGETNREGERERKRGVRTQAGMQWLHVTTTQAAPAAAAAAPLRDVG